MNELEQTIINHLKTYHYGKGRAITFKRLSAELEIGSRKLRKTVSELVKNRIACIGSTSTNGYFYIETEQEAAHCYNELRARAFDELTRSTGIIETFKRDQRLKRLAEKQLEEELKRKPEVVKQLTFV